MDIIARLNNRLDEAQAVDTSITSLLELASSKARFDSKAALIAHLTEGALLNINTLASDCLSIPSGKYVVWLTDSGKTVLAPAPGPYNEVHTKVEDAYELHTAKLLGMWNKLERIISEAPENNWRMGNERQDISGHFASAPEEMPDDPYTFGASVDRPALWQAMQRAGYGVSDLADIIGVDKSTISRLLRKVERGPGDPHGRNPSVGVAQKIAEVLGVDVNEVLPPPEDIKLPERHGTTGSGAGGGKNAAAMTAGAGPSSFGASESKLSTLVNTMVEYKVNPVNIIAETLISIPAAERVLNEFLSTVNTGSKAAHAIKSLTEAYGRVYGAKHTLLNQWLSSLQSTVAKTRLVEAGK